MCTVTYLPPIGSRGFILTSNRDERVLRSTLPPKIYNHNDVKLCYPKDEDKGGSWIAANNSGRVCCLLNGGFFPHRKQEFHTHSRGLVLLEIASLNQLPDEVLSPRKLKNTEPFTIITIDTQKDKIKHFSELIWDGKFVTYNDLDILKPRIWSSVTLYSQEQRQHRINWFNKFLQAEENNLTPDSVYMFHTDVHTQDTSINVIMEREDDLKTVSVTQIVNLSSGFNIKYTNLVEESEHFIEI